MSDGVIPSNEERGYVLRRIIRRAVRFAYLLGVEKPIAAPLAGHVAEVMGDAYPEVRSNLDLIWGVLDREEAQFRRTLRIGLGMLEDEMQGLQAGETLSGNLAFTLHDTYGFPYEVTAEMYRVLLDGARAGVAGGQLWEHGNRVAADAGLDGYLNHVYLGHTTGITTSSRPVVEHRAAAERSGDRALVCNRGRNIGLGGVPLLDRANEGIEARHAVELVGATQLRRFERPPEHGNGLVVDTQRHGERMSILAAVREGESGRIVEARGCAMHDFGNERERLQRSRAKPLQQQE